MCDCEHVLCVSVNADKLYGTSHQTHPRRTNHTQTLSTFSHTPSDVCFTTCRPSRTYESDKTYVERCGKVKASINNLTNMLNTFPLFMLAYDDRPLSMTGLFFSPGHMSVVNTHIRCLQSSSCFMYICFIFLPVRDNLITQWFDIYKSMPSRQTCVTIFHSFISRPNEGGSGWPMLLCYPHHISFPLFRIHLTPGTVVHSSDPPAIRYLALYTITHSPHTHIFTLMHISYKCINSTMTCSV